MSPRIVYFPINNPNRKLNPNSNLNFFLEISKNSNLNAMSKKISKFTTGVWRKANVDTVNIIKGSRRTRGRSKVAQGKIMMTHSLSLRETRYQQLTFDQRVYHQRREDDPSLPR